MNNNMTLEEKERYAYIQGDFRGAELYAQLIDAENSVQENEELKEDIRGLRYEVDTLENAMSRIERIVHEV